MGKPKAQGSSKLKAPAARSARPAMARPAARGTAVAGRGPAKAGGRKLATPAASSSRTLAVSPRRSAMPAKRPAPGKLAVSERRPLAGTSRGAQARGGAARGSGASARERSGAGGRGKLGVAFMATVGVAAVALLAVVALVVMSHLPVFTITQIDAAASEHVGADTIARLANVAEGTTLLNVDVGKVEGNVQRNPWVKSVHLTREFPDKLGIAVEERQVFAVVLIGAGTSAWALGDDGVWIEPVQLSAPEGGDLTDAALAKAKELGCLLISQTPSTVNPAQGSKATDDVIQAVMTYQEQLSESLVEQAQAYNVASEGSISLVLTSGLEISLGSPTEISAKQAALDEIMATYAGQLTYVNVRVPTKPTYRRVASGS